MVKGFQEHFEDKSDSPTASQESFKVFCSIAANEKWEVEGSDVRNALLQAEEMDRDVFIQPPPERARQNKIWKLKKPLYGLDTPQGNGS